MKALKAKDNIWWVGALDPDLRVFDIVMWTDFGTTYNSYLIRGAEKTVLVESVKERFFEDHLEKIREICAPEEIDYIIVNHTEPDHTGSVAKMLEHAPHAVVLGSNTAINFMKEIVNRPFPHQVVTEKDKIDIGGMTLTFLSVPMLHWPDSMFTYIPEAKALFTCDSFGCHYSSEKVFNDEIDGDFYEAYHYYFDNIIGPYKNPHMLNALDKIQGLDIEFVGNGHGPVLRKDIQKYIEMYRTWSAPPTDSLDKKIVICYVSAYGYTKQLAKTIAEGIKSAGISDISLFDLLTDDKENAKAALLASDGFLLGSPTLVGDALPPIYEMLLGFNPIIHRNKYAGSFGSYGWSGEAVPNLLARMAQLKFHLPADGYRVRLKPSEEQLAGAHKYGHDFGRALLAKDDTIASAQPETKEAPQAEKPSGGKVKKWRCLICGQIFEGETPPDPCPVCGAGASHFEQVVEDSPTFSSDTPANFVIVGGGIAAKEAAASIRLRNHAARITIVSAENSLPYNRPGLSDLVSGEIAEGNLPLDDKSWYERNDIGVRLSAHVASIDTQKKLIYLQGGESLPFDKLLLATGASPFIPVANAAGKKNVYTLRTLQDALRLVDTSKACRQAVVVGGGILGLEAAWALRARGLDITIVEFAQRLMSVQLDETGSSLLQAKLDSLGIPYKTGRRVEQVSDTGVILDNGESIDADLVLFSSGVRSNTELAKEAGLEVERGIVTNSLMETSVPGIYAAGDCAQVNGSCLALWPIAMAHGQTAGANMAGDWVVLKPQVPSTVFEAFDMNIFSAGDIRDGENTSSIIYRDEENGIYKKLVLKDRRVIGGLLIGDTQAGTKLLRAVEKSSSAAAALDILK